MRYLFLALLLLTLCLSGAFAQTETFRDPLREGILWDGDKAIVVGTSVLLTPGRVYEPAPCPKGRYALLWPDEARRLPRGLQDVVFPEQNNRERRLILWNSAKGKATNVWKYLPAENEYLTMAGPYWIPETYTAVMLITSAVKAKQPPFRLSSFRFSLVTINAIEGSSTAHPLNLPGKAMSLMVHPTKPIVLVYTIELNGASEEPTLIWQINPEGQFLTEKPLVTLPELRLFNNGFTSDDRVIGTIHEFDVNKSEYVAIDLKTGKMSSSKERPASYVSPLTVLEEATSRLPFKLDQVKTRLAPETGGSPLYTRTVNTLYVSEKATDASTPPANVLLEEDADSPFLLPDGSAVLYTTRAGMFATPLYRLDRALVEARIQDSYKSIITDRMSAIADALERLRVKMASDDYPPLGSDIRALFTKEKIDFVRDEYFLDPRTGKNAFTYLHNGKADATGSKLLFSFTVPGGRFTKYSGGAMKWQPDKP